MKRLLTPRKTLALLVMGLGANTFALSVGPLQGTTGVGRPLDLSARVQLDSRGRDAGCVRADVLYGDTPLAPEQLNVDVVRHEGDDAVVRVRSPRLVNEPVVTVVLSAGCQDPMTRRFVVLADPPRDAPLAAAPQPARAILPVPAVVARGDTVVAAKPRQAAHRAGSQSPATLKTARASREPASRVSSRLHLEGGLIPVPAGLLRVSTEMAPPTNEPTRRAAAALLWQAINAQPQDLLRMGDRLHRLEGELASLREISGKHRDEIARLRDAPQASAWSVNWPWLAALLGAAGLMLAWLGVRGTSRGRAAPAWSRVPAGPQTDLDHLDFEVPEPLQPGVASTPRPVPRPASAVSSQPAPSGPASVPSRELPVLHDEVGAAPPELQPLEFELSQPAFEPAAPAVASLPALPAGGLKLASLSSALQESEFLLSLGYTDKAIDVLRAYVEDTRAPSALAVLELLHLCREAGDQEGIAASQDQFRRLFGEEPPRHDAASGLEACEPALARIMSAWPEPQVLDIIEQLLFSPPAVLGGFPSLHAWRDLLWLHGLARDTLRGLGSLPAEAEDDFVASAEGTEEMTLERLAGIDVDRSSQRFGVDVDLNPVDSRLHRVLDLKDVPRLPPIEEPVLALAPVEPAPPAAPPQNYEDFFDAALAAEGRSLFMHR
jgi:hypothetical protein